MFAQIGWDLIEHLRQHESIANFVRRDLDGPNLQRFFVDPYVYLAPTPALQAAVLSGVPRTFALGLDARAIDKLVRRVAETQRLRRLSLGCGSQSNSGSNQTDSEPRRLWLFLYADQFVALYCVGAQLIMPSSYHSGFARRIPKRICTVEPMLYQTGGGLLFAVRGEHCTWR